MVASRLIRLLDFCQSVSEVFNQPVHTKFKISVMCAKIHLTDNGMSVCGV